MAALRVGAAAAGPPEQVQHDVGATAATRLRDVSARTVAIGDAQSRPTLRKGCYSLGKVRDSPAVR